MSTVFSSELEVRLRVSEEHLGNLKIENTGNTLKVYIHVLYKYIHNDIHTTFRETTYRGC